MQIFGNMKYVTFINLQSPFSFGVYLWKRALNVCHSGECGQKLLTSEHLLSFIFSLNTFKLDANHPLNTYLHLWSLPAEHAQMLTPQTLQYSSTKIFPNTFISIMYLLGI